MARSLNKVTLIGNLTRDPELRYTPQGTPVCSFGVATNRQWKTEDGGTQDEAEFHNITAWNQLAEICNKLLKKGNRVYVEGRIKSREWTGQDKVKRTRVEIVINEMILLTSKGEVDSMNIDVPDDLGEQVFEQEETAKKAKPTKTTKKSSKKSEDEDIPF